jgi:cytochrome P450
MISSQPNSLPGNVHPHQVVDFDIYTDDRLLEDTHAGYKEIQRTAPDIFYTPRNGGHWVVTRYDLQSAVLRDSQHFSSHEMTIPKLNSPNVMIPINLDPPDHAPYRNVLIRYFDRKSIAGMESTLVAWANRLIDGVIADGKCDFSETLGAGFPVSVFMEMMGMPLDRFEEFRRIAREYFATTDVARRIQIQDQILAVVGGMIEDRKLKPGDDLLSKLIGEKVHERPLTFEEIRSIGFLLFLAGLDTVANALTFAFRHLALDPALQRRLSAEPGKIPDFVEESLRCYGVSSPPRIVKKEIRLGGADLRVGDMILCPLTLAGVDERKNQNPERFDIDRKDRAHLVFSTGAHMCIGNLLARAEMRVFTHEWLKRIPAFRLAAGSTLKWRPTLHLSLTNLPLEWPAAGANTGQQSIS